jgi:hypothetical protein
MPEQKQVGKQPHPLEEVSDTVGSSVDGGERETDLDDDAEDVGDHLAGATYEAAIAVIMPTPKAEARATTKANAAAAKAKAKATPKAKPEAKPEATAKSKADAAAAIATVPLESTELVEAGNPRLVKRARICEHVLALLRSQVDSVPGELNQSSTIVAYANQGAGSSTDLPPDATTVVHANQGASSSTDVHDAGIARDSPPTQAVVEPRRPQLLFHGLRSLLTTSYSKASCIAVRAARTTNGTGTGCCPRLKERCVVRPVPREALNCITGLVRGRR